MAIYSCKRRKKGGRNPLLNHNLKRDDEKEPKPDNLFDSYFAATDRLKWSN